MRNFGSRLFCAILCLVLVSTCMIGIASAEIRGEWTGIYWKLDDGKLTITGIGGSLSFNFDDETSAFHEYKDEIREVDIKMGITEIGQWAFHDFTSLTSVTLPDSLQSIGDGAFGGCSALSSIVIPDSVTSIGQNVFNDCSSLTSINIPKSLTRIEYMSFYRCSSLTSVTIPDSVTSIGGWAFMECSGLTSVTLPDSVTSIEDAAFALCTSLTSITIPDNVASIGMGAFGGCSALESITIPKSVTSIGSSAFEGCSSLKSITIPEGVTSIGSSAFSECPALESITIPKSVTSIGSSAFEGCSSLKSITIPEGVTSIGSSAFSECPALESIAFPDSITSIESNMFWGCSALSFVEIPRSVTSIGDYAFSSCTALTFLTLPDSITNIGNRAFSYCSSLASITIPAGVTSIGEMAFPDDTLLFVEAGSYAEEYCRKNYYRYEKYISPENAGFSITAKDNVSLLTAGKSLQLTVTFEYPDIINKKEKNDSITWSVLNASTQEACPSASVNANGQLKVDRSLDAPVDLLIKGTSIYGTEAIINITAIPVVTKVNVDPAELILYIGSSDPQTAKASLVPDTVPPACLTWTPANKKLISITEAGEGTVSILPLEAGKTTVTVKEPNGKTAALKVSVLIPVESVELTVKGTVKAGALVNIVPAVLPKNAGSKSVTYSLDVGEDIAKINKEGQLRIGKDVPSGTKITVTCTSAWAPVPVSGSVTIEIP